MIDLLICCLELLPFLREDIQLRSGDHGAQASAGHWGPSPYHATKRETDLCRFRHIQHLADRYKSL